MLEDLDLPSALAFPLLDSILRRLLLNLLIQMRFWVDIGGRVFLTILDAHMIELIIGLFLHYLAVAGGLEWGLEFCCEQLGKEISVGGHGGLEEL